MLLQVWTADEVGGTVLRDKSWQQKSTVAPAA